MPPGFWANAASVTDIAISNAPAAANARKFCFTHLPRFAYRAAARPLLVEILDEAGGLSRYPRLIAESHVQDADALSFITNRTKGAGWVKAALDHLRAHGIEVTFEEDRT